MITNENVDLTSEQMLELAKIKAIGEKQNKWKSIKQRQKEEQEEQFKQDKKEFWEFLGISEVEEK